MRTTTLAAIFGCVLPATAAKFMVLSFNAAAVTYSWNVTDWKLSNSNGVYDYSFKIAADPLKTGSSNTVAIPGFVGTCTGSGPEDILPTTCKLLSSDPVSDNVALSAGIVKNNSPYLRFGSTSLQKTYGGIDHLEVYMIFSSTVKGETHRQTYTGYALWSNSTSQGFSITDMNAVAKG